MSKTKVICTEWALKDKKTGEFESTCYGQPWTYRSRSEARIFKTKGVKVVKVYTTVKEA